MTRAAPCLLPHRLWGCALLSLLLHVLLLSPWLAGEGDLSAANLAGSVRPTLPPPGGRAALAVTIAPVVSKPLPAVAALPLPSPDATAEPAPRPAAAEEATASAAASLLGVERYYTAPELDTLAQAITPIFIEPDAGENEPLLIAVYINQQGQVDRVTVESGDAHGELAQAALANFAAAQFTPAILQGRAVKSVKRIEITPAPF